VFHRGRVKETDRARGRPAGKSHSVARTVPGSKTTLTIWGVVITTWRPLPALDSSEKEDRLELYIAVTRDQPRGLDATVLYHTNGRNDSTLCDWKLHNCFIL